VRSEALSFKSAIYSEFILLDPIENHAIHLPHGRFQDSEFRVGVVGFNEVENAIVVLNFKQVFLVGLDRFAGQNFLDLLGQKPIPFQVRGRPSLA